MVARDSDPRNQLHLPPGFRFFPTDEELLVQYLCRKVAGYQFSLPIIGEIDLYKFNPWELPDKALFGEKEWYFFSPRERKYPNGSRPNRVAGAGYWKATGTDKTIMTEGRKVGIKKALVFYVGKAPNGSKTNWIMHEYRLSDSGKKNSSKRLDDWVLCRIYMKSTGGRKAVSHEFSHGDSSPSSSSQYDDVLDTLPEANDGFFNLPPLSSLNTVEDQKPTNLQPLSSGNFFDYPSLSAFPVPGSEFFRYEDTTANVGVSGTRSDAVPPPADVDAQVRNGHGNQRLNFLARSFNGSFDPSWAHYSAHNCGFGLRQ